MFQHLRTKLTVFFGGLLGLILLAVAGAVFLFVQHTARTNVESDLTATAAVYERLWNINATQLAINADLMARDFGFRGAVATEDIATVSSALDNLRNRIQVSRAFVVFADGRTLESGQDTFFTPEADILAALRDEDRSSGIMLIADEPFQAVSAPILAPNRIGWVVFASRLDANQMRELEALSPIAITASIETKSTGEDANLTRSSIRAATPLDSFSGNDAKQLVLTYPLSKAMAPFRSMLIAIAILAVIGLIALLVCSWTIANSLTRPIARLDRAARNFAHGEDVNITVDSQDEIGRLSHSFSVMIDEIEARESRIRRLSLMDLETDLPNRRSLQNAVDLENKAPASTKVFIAAVGIDRFGHILSAIGQANANNLLRDFGETLSRHRHVSAIGRLSTDIIGALVLAPDRSTAEMMCTDLSAELSSPLRVSGEMIDIQVSVGISGNDDAADLAPIDAAIVARQQGERCHDPVQFFDQTTYGNPSATLSLMSDMIAALGDDTMYLAYQPKYNLRSGKVESAEALLRWVHPEKGFIPPDLFVNYSEETGHILHLSEWVIKRAISDRAIFAAHGHELKISINISGRLLTNRKFLEWAIEQLGDNAAQYCFEVTETAVIQDPAQALENILLLQQSGIEISIDDYGSGLSSLSYLKQIPAQELKIDKCFVLPLAAGSSDALLVKSTIDLAHSLGMQVTAEGVETAEAMTLLAGMGADIAQGYFICRPAAVDDILTYLEGEKSKHAMG